MPYAHGPSVKKLSKMATLLLARNYIILLNRSVDEMRRMLADLYRQQMGVNPTATQQAMLNAHTHHSRRRSHIETPVPKNIPSTPAPINATAPKSPTTSVPQTLLAASAPTYLNPSPQQLLLATPPSLPGTHPAIPGLPSALPNMSSLLHGLGPAGYAIPPGLAAGLPSMATAPTMLSSDAHLLHAMHHTGTDSCTCAYCHIGLKQEAMFKV